ncbi:hypothetical protein C8R14_1651, partial [Nitrosomonas eutropha]
LERLLLGKAAKRPDYWTEEERARRTAKCQAILKKFKLS